MVNAGSVVAHFVKLLVTTICMGHLAKPYRTKAQPTTWSLRAFRILFMHSILGIFRFGRINASVYRFLDTCCSFDEYLISLGSLLISILQFYSVDPLFSDLLILNRNTQSQLDYFAILSRSIVNNFLLIFGNEPLLGTLPLSIAIFFNA